MFEFIAQIFRNMFVFVGMVTTKSSFPPALTPEEEQALLKKLAAGDDDARDKLIEHNLRLVAHIAKKYTTRGRDADDLISIGLLWSSLSCRAERSRSHRHFRGDPHIS